MELVTLQDKAREYNHVLTKYGAESATRWLRKQEQAGLIVLAAIATETSSPSARLLPFSNM